MPFDDRRKDRNFVAGPRTVFKDIESLYERIEERKDLNAYVFLTKERALERAQQSDKRLSLGTSLPLDGLPLAIKDNFCTEGVRTTAGSKILHNFVPTYESFVTKQLLDAGAVFLGKTNMDAFGMGSSTENSMFGPTLNPNIRSDGARVVPGGSSGGSAAAVAARLAAAAIGSDTGGSLRQPAAFCGVVGFKPTYGLCSRWGLIAYASSLDQAGVITQNVLDAAILLDVIVSHDVNDSTSFKWPGGRFEQRLESQDVTANRKVSIGIPREFRNHDSDDLSKLWANSIAYAQDAGFEIREISLPHAKFALPTYYIIALCEASSNLARYDGVRYGHRAANVKDIYELYAKSRFEGFSEEVRKRILLGTFALSAGYYDEYYGRATKVRRVLYEEFAREFRKVDFMMWPTAPTPAFEFGHGALDPLLMYLEDIFTVPVNLIGSPAVSIPICDGKGNLPMGIQLVGPRLSDADLLAAAGAIERAAQYQRPCIRN